MYLMIDSHTGSREKYIGIGMAAPIYLSVIRDIHCSRVSGTLRAGRLMEAQLTVAHKVA